MQRRRLLTGACRAVTRALALLVLLLLAKGLLGSEAAAPPPEAPLKFIVVAIPSHNSPLLDVMGVTAQLQSRGHEVHVVADEDGEAYARMAAARHSSNTTAQALRFVRVEADEASTLDALLSNIGPEAAKSFGQSRTAGLKLLLLLPQYLANPAKRLLSNATLVQHLRSLRADAVVAFTIPGPSRDSMGCLVSHLLGIPWVSAYGNPMINAPLGVPQVSSGNTPADLRTLRGAARNLASFIVLNHALPVATRLLGCPWAKTRAALGLPQLRSGPGWLRPLGAPLRRLRAALAGRPQQQQQQPQSCEPLVEALLNTWALEYPRPLAPYQVLVGPGTPRPAQPLSPPEVADFVESAPAGVVLMATGTTPQSRLVLTAADVLALARGFAALAPTRVLWPIKARHLPPGVALAEVEAAAGPGVLLVPWVDYNDVLGHPHTRALVSHCGWHSVHEAAFHGVPVVGVPFQVEQAENNLRLVHRGMAVTMPHAPAMRHGRNVSWTAQEVADTIREVMQEPRYATAARSLSVALQAYARARQPYARAADEMELALYARRAAQQHQQWAQEGGAGAGEGEGGGGGGQQQHGGAGQAEL